MRIKLFWTAAIIAACLGAKSASAALIESWENTSDATFDGWTTNLQPYTASYDTIGATDGAHSLAMTGTASPSYGQMLRSSFLPSLTSALAHAQSVSFDVTVPNGAFGGFLQFDVDINNNDTGFVSLDGFSYIAATIGGTKTITVPVSASLQSTLSASSNPTQLIIQVGGGSSGNPQTFYVDNIRTTAAPEPASLAMAALAAIPLLARRRRA
jgi:hypothetical protein